MSREAMSAQNIERVVLLYQTVTISFT